MNNYEYWLTFDEETKKELESITDKAELEDRFYKELEFGTGGLRGIMGAGANRMNKYTVSKATKGLADYLNEAFEEPTVAIAYDSRIKSDIGIQQWHSLNSSFVRCIGCKYPGW